jgi:AraC-like DNA-binding protein
MEVNQNLYLLIFALPVYQILFYTIQVITVNRSKYPKWILGLLFSGITVYLVINSTLFLGFNQLYYFLFPLLSPILLAFLPLHYLYLEGISGDFRSVVSARKLLIFAPSIFLLVLNLLFYSLLTKDEIIFLQGNGIKDFPQAGFLLTIYAYFNLIASVVFVPVQVILFFRSASLKKKYFVVKDKADPVSGSHVEIKWQAIMVISISVIAVASAILNVWVPIGEFPVLLIYNLLLLVFTGLLGYYGLKQENLYEQVRTVPVGYRQTEEFQGTGSPELIQKAPGVSELSKEETEVAKLIERSMTSDEMYLKHNLTVSSLSEHIGVPARTVTDLIKSVYHSNFYGMVNGYRIRKACDLINSGNYGQYTIETLARMSGFKSKSSFNACFKKYTGMTPTDYKHSKEE